LIINELDLGEAGVTSGPAVGQVVASTQVEGGRAIAYSRGGKLITRSMVVSVQASSAIGGAAAYSRAANAYLVQQLVELAGNRNLGAVVIQWTSGAGVVNPNKWDGWWILDDAEPLDWHWPNHVDVRIRATFVGPLPPSPLAMNYVGGALASNFSGAAIAAIGYPFGATRLATPINRTGAEGAYPLSLAPSAPSTGGNLRFLPGTLAQLFQGCVRVYDTLVVGGNPVSTTGGYVHASWVRVYGVGHTFIGDVVITNGLHLYRLQTGTAHTLTAYLWSTAQATPGWLQFATLDYQDNAANAGTLDSFSLDRVGLDEARVTANLSTSAGNSGTFTVRLQRSQEFGRVEFTPNTEANTNANGLSLTLVANPKIVYNSTKATDNLVGGSGVSFATDYGYGVGFVNSTAQPFIAGILYQNEPSQQPNITAGAALGFGDTTGPAQYGLRSYGIYAVPFGTSTTTTDKLQGECESAALASGFASVADGAASNGNAAKLPSGNAAGASCISPLWTPAAGTYKLAIRYRNSGLPTAVTEVRLGAVIAGGFVDQIALGSAQGSLVTYTWFVSPAFALSGAQTFQMELTDSGFSTTKDYYFDEWALLPVTLTTAATGPQEIYQQFRSATPTSLVRL
jgi:hypothetical protein